MRARTDRPPSLGAPAATRSPGRCLPAARRSRTAPHVTYPTVCLPAARHSSLALAREAGVARARRPRAYLRLAARCGRVLQLARQAWQVALDHPPSAAPYHTVSVRGSDLIRAAARTHARLRPPPVTKPGHLSAPKSTLLSHAGGSTLL